MPAQWVPARAIAMGGVLSPQDLESVASDTAKEALFYCQKYRSSGKSDLRCGVSPGEEKNPRHDTKLLLRSTIT